MNYYISNFERPKSQSNISRGEIDYFIKTNKMFYPFTVIILQIWRDTLSVLCFHQYLYQLLDLG